MELNVELFNKFKGHTGIVKYWLFRCDKPIEGSIHMPTIEGIPTESKNPQTNSACFASLNYELNKKWKDKKYNRICYQLGSFAIDCGPFKITNSQREKWLTLCKKNGLLPDYVPIVKLIRRKEIVLALDKHTKNQIYVYLSCFRFLMSEAGFFGAAITLIENGMHIYPAIILASKISMGNSNHHFLPSKDCVSYMKPRNFNINNANIRLCTLIGLHRLIAKGNGEMMLTESHKRGLTLNGSGFTCNKTIENSTELQEILTVPMMLHPMASTLASVTTDDQATTFLNVMKKAAKTAVQNTEE